MTQNSLPLIPSSRRAYRAWYLDYDHSGPLRALNARNGVWLRSRQIATCMVEDADRYQDLTYERHRAPAENCSCGVYAKYHLEQVWEEVHKPHLAVFGALDISGVTYEHQKGVRAERADIRGLWISPFTSVSTRKIVAENLSYTYRVPVFRSDEDLLDAFPPDKDVPEPSFSHQRMYEEALRKEIIAINQNSATITLGGGGSHGYGSVIALPGDTVTVTGYNGQSTVIQQSTLVQMDKAPTPSELFAWLEQTPKQ